MVHEPILNGCCVCLLLVCGPIVSLCKLLLTCLQTYVTNINAQVDKFPELKDLGLVTLNQSIGTSKIPKEANTAVR